MPLYEYQCNQCHALTERIVKYSDPPLTVCPKCGGEVEQLISAPAIQFKGSGWYVSDYAKKSSAPAAAGGNGSSSSSSEPSSSEAKPAAGKIEASSKPEPSKSEAPKSTSAGTKDNP